MTIYNCAGDCGAFIIARDEQELERKVKRSSSVFVVSEDKTKDNRWMCPKCCDRRITVNELDLLVPCPECMACVGNECMIEPLIHFGRRIVRLLKERGATVEDIEKAMKTGEVIN